MIERPFFIVGAERSGTTLLRLMLDHHPLLACHFEFEHAVEIVGDDGSFPPIEEYHRWLPSRRSFTDSGVTVDASLDYPRLVDSFLAQKRDRDGKKLVGATVHKHFNRLRYIWPDARFIHIIRDGRDVARSCVAIGWAGNTWGGADRWIDAETLWDELQPKLSPADYCEIHYEDLIADPRKVLTRLCELIGVDFDEAMFSYVDKSTYDFPDPKLVYQWKVKASEEQTRITEAKIGEMLVRRGYELSGFPKLEVDAALARRLEKENAQGRRRFRIKRYGFPLLALENLIRRLPFRPSHSLFFQRMADIDRQHLK